MREFRTIPEYIDGLMEKPLSLEDCNDGIRNTTKYGPVTAIAYHLGNIAAQLAQLNSNIKELDITLHNSIHSRGIDREQAEKLVENVELLRVACQNIDYNTEDKEDPTSADNWARHIDDDNDDTDDNIDLIPWEE